MNLNNEQRKHLAVTLRTIGFGAMTPFILSIAGSEISLSGATIAALVIAVGFLEFAAMLILGGVTK